MNSSKYKALTSTGFIVALLLLLFNDFLLKGIFHNWLTGKLSDFAGLFVFPLFFAILFPAQKRLIYILTAAFFVWWKSTLSQPCIELVNSFSSMHFNRVIDYSDLLALFILPFSFLYLNGTKQYLTLLQPAFMIVTASFAFVATSKMNEVEVNTKKEYTFGYSYDTLKSKLSKLKTIDNPYYHREVEDYRYVLHNESYDPNDTLPLYRISKHNGDTLFEGQIPFGKYRPDTMQLSVLEDDAYRCYYAHIIISGDKRSSKIRLLRFSGFSNETDTENDRKNLTESFEKKVIFNLRQ